MTSRDILTSYRPTDDDLADAWPVAAREALRDRIVTTTPDGGAGLPPTSPSWVRRHRRWVAIGTAAACLAAAGAFVSVALPGGAPGAPDAAAAGTIERLAVVAGEQGGTVRPGQFAYSSVVERTPVKPGDPMPPGQPQVGDFSEWARRQWVAPNGDRWVYTTRFVPTACLRMTEGRPSGLATPASGAYEDLSSAELATLPTEPEKLAAFLDAHPTGSNHGATNRYLAVADFMRSGLATPQLRAAALRVLAQTDGIEVSADARDSLGRPATRVGLRTKVRVPPKYLFRYQRSTQSLYFDPATSRLLEQSGAIDGQKPGGTVIKDAAIVDSVPTDLPVCPPPADLPLPIPYVTAT